MPAHHRAAACRRWHSPEEVRWCVGEDIIFTTATHHVGIRPFGRQGTHREGGICLHPPTDIPNDGYPGILTRAIVANRVDGERQGVVVRRDAVERLVEAPSRLGLEQGIQLVLAGLQHVDQCGPGNVGQAWGQAWG